MKIALCALTKNGAALALKMGDALKGDVYIKKQNAAENPAKAALFECSLQELIDEIYPAYDAFVMIMATGIVMRTFASLLESKVKDRCVCDG